MVKNREREKERGGIEIFIRKFYAVVLKEDFVLSVLEVNLQLFSELQ